MKLNIFFARSFSELCGAAETLIKKGADVHAVNSYKKNALLYALNSGNNSNLFMWKNIIAIHNKTNNEINNFNFKTTIAIHLYGILLKTEQTLILSTRIAAIRY